ncbi:hypothetical protein DSL92_04710 [Billgrantia gudaonensis]|uniref:HAMP domain-containing protein n=1 Tax=Billgrantia gudaonensis TaxID=376427 RepID=A0A432JJB7_9GAMM|nr:hypothetical protein DSL92_04710 [Halomonas gudaonensis]
MNVGACRHPAGGAGTDRRRGVGVRVNVLKPLRRIVEHFQRIAAGDLATPVERRGTTRSVSCSPNSPPCSDR